MEAFRRNYNSIDLFKFIMAFAVVALHTEPLYGLGDGPVVRLYSFAVSMAVPFFFLASGYLLGSGMDLTGNEKDLERLKKHTVKILKMYLIWTAVYLPLTLWYFISTGTGIARSILIFIRGLVLVGEQYNSWPLWYLLATVYSLLFLSLYMKRFNKPAHLIVLSVIASILSVGLTAFVKYEGAYPSWAETLRGLIYLAIGNGRIFSGLVYIPAGMLMTRKSIPAYLNPALLLAGAAIRFLTADLILTGYAAVISSLGLFGLVKDLSLKDRSVYKDLRYMSTVIYLIHMYVWSIYYKVVYGTKTFGPDSFAVTSVISLLIAAAVCLFRKRKIISDRS